MHPCALGACMGARCTHTATPNPRHVATHPPPPAAAINEALASTKEAAKEPGTIKAILTAASDRAMLKNATPGARC
jgi:hypothetical protein